MKRVFQPLGLLLALIFAVAIGVGLSPLERPHPATAQGVGPAQIVQGQGSCSGVPGSMFAFYFSANPLHYTFTQDRGGNIGVCPEPTGSGGGSITAPGNITTTNGMFVGSGLGLVFPGFTNSTNVCTNAAVPPGLTTTSCNNGTVTSVTGTQNILCTGSTAVVCNVASPAATASPLTCTGWSATFALLSIPCTASGATVVSPGPNIVIGGTAGNPVVAVASPALTSWPVSNCGAWSATFALQYFPCPATPYPTPIPTCAGTTCSFAGYTLTVPTPIVTSANANCTVSGLTITCVTPTPKPDPTSANANCSFAVQVLTCVTPAPQNTNVPMVLVVAPTTTTFAQGVVSEPFMLNPSASNIVATGGAFVCDTAGSTGSAAAITWQTNTSNPAPADGTWATVAAVPTISAASNAKAAGQATFAATTFPTDAGAAHITWVRAFVVTSPTTPLSGACRMQLFLRQSTL